MQCCRLPHAFRTSRDVRTHATPKMSSQNSTAYSFLGHSIPPMGLGLAALGRPGYINVGHDEHLAEKDVESMRAQSYAVLDAAYERGIRYFDAARSYGKAEDFLGGWLESRKPQGVVVGSKWGYYYTADWRIDTVGDPHEVKDHTAPHLRKQWKETDALLGKYLNLYQIHSATLESGVLDDPEVAKELFELKHSKGWKIGLSLSGVKQAETLAKALTITNEQGELIFDSVQATWNLMEQSVGPALLDAHTKGLSVIVKEGAANGRVLNAGPFAKLEPRVQALRDAAKQLNTQPDALALAAILVQPFHPMVLSGAATTDHALSNFEALRLMENPQLIVVVQRLMEEMRQEPTEYWGDRAGLAWN